MVKYRGTFLMRKLPIFLRGNVTEALDSAATPSHVIATRNALLRYRMSIQDGVSTNASAVIKSELDRFASTGAIQNPDDQDIIRTRIGYYFSDGKKNQDFASARTITRFCNEYPYEPRKEALAVIRDFLIWTRFLHESELAHKHAILSTAYELKRVFKPTGTALFSELSAKDQNYWFFGKFEELSDQFETKSLHICRISEGVFNVKLEILKKNKKSAEQYDLGLSGWIFSIQGQAFGSLISDTGYQPSVLHIILEPSTQNGIQISLADTIKETTLQGKFATTPEVFTSYSSPPKFAEDIKNMHNKQSSFVTRKIPGGKKFLRDERTYNADLGGTLDDKTKLGLQLAENFRDIGLLPFSGAERHEKLSKLWEQQKALFFEAGAPVDIPVQDGQFAGYTSLHFMAMGSSTSLLEYVFKRDDVNYLVQTPNGDYAFDILTRRCANSYSDVQEELSYAEELFKRALEQGKSLGITREQLLKLPDDAPPLPSVSDDVEDGPG